MKNPKLVVRSVIFASEEERVSSYLYIERHFRRSIYSLFLQRGLSEETYIYFNGLVKIYVLEHEFLKFRGRQKCLKGTSSLCVDTTKEFYHYMVYLFKERGRSDDLILIYIFVFN